MDATMLVDRAMKKKQPIGKKICDDVTKFLKFRKEFETFWTTMEEAYRRRAYETGEKDKDSLDEIYPGRVYRIVHTTESQLFSNNVKFFIENFGPRLGGDVQVVCEDLTNSDWIAEGELTREVRITLRDCTKKGVAVMWTSYECDYDEEEKEDRRPKRRKKSTTAPNESAIESQVETAVASRLINEPDEDVEASFEVDSRAVRERIVSRRISPWDLLIDPDARSIYTAAWVGRVVFADLETVKEYEFFSNTADLKATSRKLYMERTGRSSSEASTENSDDSTSDKIMLYEMFTRESDGSWTMRVIDAESGAVIREKEGAYWIGHPASILDWNADGETIFAQSDLLTIYTELLAERLVGTKTADGFARQQDNATYYRKDAIDPKEMKAHYDSAVGKMIGISLPNDVQDIRTAVTRLPESTQAGEVLNYLMYLDRTIGMTTGMSPNQMGQALKSGTTATEASTISQYATVATAHKAAAVELFLADIATKRLGLAIQFYDVNTIVKILGQTAGQLWSNVAWVKSDVTGGMRISVRPGSSRAVSDDVRAQRMFSVIETIGKFPAVSAIINPVTLWKELFRSIGIDSNSGLFVSDNPAVLAQVLQAAQQAMAQPQGSAPASGAKPSSEAGMAQTQ